MTPPIRNNIILQIIDWETLKDLQSFTTLIAICCLSAGIFVFSTSIRAEGALIPDQVVLDGSEFSKAQLYHYFLDAAFTSDLLGKPRAPVQSNLSGDAKYYSKENIREHYPWLYPHIFPQYGLPLPMAINKWVKPIRISTGLPNDLISFGPLAAGNRPFAIFSMAGDYYWSGAKKQREDFEGGKTFQEIEKFITDLTEQLQGLGLEASYLPHNQEDTNLTHTGSLRIVFVDKEHFAGSVYRDNGILYRTYFGIGQFKPMDFRTFITGRVWTGFPFAADAEKQVHGHFLSTVDNEIDMAFCYIWNGHEIPLLKALVTECIVRSLGFPGSVSVRGYKSAPISALTLWNEPDKWPQKHQDKIELPVGLSEFDKSMIRLLYDDRLVPGTNFLEAQEMILGLDHTGADKMQGDAK